ncbi:MAG: DNA topoisomerase VI subunit B, partial [Pirellulaceae bacterium]|nr:DNA topoisomerase VI subunit B [Pirellulaceae bacterium]
VPFTSESKEAIAAYPEIEKELRLALQTVGRKLGMFLRRRHSIRQEGERRSIFLRYLGEVASALHAINGVDRDEIYENLLRVAKRKTAEADTKLDEKGRKLDPDTVYGENVLIVEEDQESLEKELLQRSKSRTPDPNENTTEE